MHQVTAPSSAVKRIKGLTATSSFSCAVGDKVLPRVCIPKPHSSILAYLCRAANLHLTRMPEDGPIDVAIMGRSRIFPKGFNLIKTTDH